MLWLDHACEGRDGIKEVRDKKESKSLLHWTLHNANQNVNAVKMQNIPEYHFSLFSWLWPSEPSLCAADTDTTEQLTEHWAPPASAGDQNQFIPSVPQHPLTGADDSPRENR